MVLSFGKEFRMKITTTAFPDRGSIPPKYTCDGANISPELSWSGVPEAARSLVLLMDDPDAPVGTWSHWTVYNIPPEATGLPEGTPTLEKLPRGMLQGKNSFHKIGYGGPCPPPGHGPHRYFFRLYALNKLLDLRPGVSRIVIDEAIRGYVIARAELMGRFERRIVKQKISYEPFPF
jgi:Raf kinase inhibitor-like YbhB/YbcL family protein